MKKIAKKNRFSIKKKLEALLVIISTFCLIQFGTFVIETPFISQSKDNSVWMCKVNGGTACLSIQANPKTKQKKEQGPIPKAEAAESNAKDFCLAVPILMYHHIQPWDLSIKKGQTALSVDPSTFDSHLSYIKDSGYNVISAKELIDALQKHAPPVPKSIVITLDDGYRDAYEYALPIIKKYNIKTELLIPTGLLEGEDYLTWNQLREMNDTGLISIINHTWSHHNMNQGSKDELRKEVESAQNAFYEHLKEKPYIFGYPYGAYNDIAIEVLREQGFIAGLSTIQSALSCESSIMALPRLRIGEGHLSSYGL